eukprot:5889477-Ditylum_brightwellii.AAC.1
MAGAFGSSNYLSESNSSIWASHSIFVIFHPSEFLFCRQDSSVRFTPFKYGFLFALASYHVSHQPKTIVTNCSHFSCEERPNNPTLITALMILQAQTPDSSSVDGWVFRAASCWPR